MDIYSQGSLWREEDTLQGMPTRLRITTCLLADLLPFTSYLAPYDTRNTPLTAFLLVPTSPQFVVDGTWQHATDQEMVQDGQGNTNNIFKGEEISLSFVPRPDMTHVFYCHSISL